MNKHTEGTGILGFSLFKVVEFASQRFEDIEHYEDDDDHGQWVQALRGDLETVEKNLKVFQTAPDLLEAANEAIEDISDGDFALASKRLSDAISKAEGRKDKDNTSGWFGLPEEGK